MHPGEKNINTFRILFLIKGILDLLIVLVGVLYMALGSAAGPAMEQSARMQGDPMPFNPANIFLIAGIIMISVALLTGIPALLASSRLAQKRGRKLIIIAAAINCITGILGILLCVFTVIEMQKPEVKELFAENDGQ